MGRKNVAMPYHCITNGNMVGNITGLETDVTYLDNAAYQAVWTGTPTGSFIIEATVDGVTWSSLDPRDADGNPPVAAGAAGNLVINLNQLPFKKIRFMYLAVSGSGTLNVYTMSKQIGG